MPSASLRNCLRALASLACVLSSQRALAIANGPIFSGPVSPDAMSVYFNPAAMTLLRSNNIMLWGDVASIRIQYQRRTESSFDGTRFPQARLNLPTVNASFTAVTDAGLDRWRFGFGFFVPFREGSSWETVYDGRPSSTRYYSIKAAQAHFYWRPTVAYQVNKYLSIALGVDIVAIWLFQDVMTDLAARINQAACVLDRTQCQTDAPLARENPAFDAPTRIRGLGWGAGVVGGVLLTPFRWLRVGASVHSGAQTIDVPLKVEVDIPQQAVDYVSRNLPSLKLPLLSAKGETQATSAMTITAGLAVKVSPKLELLADIHWMQKSKMASFVATFTESNTELIADQVSLKSTLDDILYGVMAKYRLFDPLTLAFRVEYDPFIRPEAFMTPISMDFNKIHLRFGAAWQVVPWLRLQFEYAQLFLLPREVRRSRFSPIPLPTTRQEPAFDKPYPLGRYDGQAFRLSLAAEVSW